MQHQEDGGGQSIPPSEHVLFSGANFAPGVDSFYSNSGSILYVRGTPIAWRPGRQKVRAHSTCEAEWIAAAGGITWVNHNELFRIFRQYK